MKHSNHLFLVLSISIINSAFVRNSSIIQNISTKNVTEDVAVTDSNTISDVDITTVESNVTEESNSTENEEQQSSEYDNSVHQVDPRYRNSLKGGVPSKPFVMEIDENPDYVRGYFGGYYFNGSDNSHYYTHGKYSKPTPNYYGNYNHTLKDKSPLGYYLGYAMTKMDHNEYFMHHNFTHYDIHHYFYMNSTMFPEQKMLSNHLISCAQNTSTFCPESTEAICLLNTTVWCGSKLTFVNTCEEFDTKRCAVSRIPCVKSDDANCHQFIEDVKLPCISMVTILDEHEDKNGLTFNNVAGTFVLAPVLSVEERTYCITIVAEPRKDSVNR